MRKNKKQSMDPKDLCQAEADEVKYMMLLNALNESQRQEEADTSELHEDGESERP